MRALRSHGGFTLVELLVVLVIIAIATAVAVPALWKTYGKAQLRACARTLAAQIQLARTRAALQATPQVVSINMEERSSRLFAHPSGQELQEDAGDLLQLPVAVSFKSVNLLKVPSLIEQHVEKEGKQAQEELPTYDLEFLPQGLAEGAKIVLQDTRGRAFTVKVDPGTGIVSVTEGEEEDDEQA